MSQRHQQPSKKRNRRSNSSATRTTTGLEAKVAETGGRLGYGLEANDQNDVTSTRNEGAGVYGSRALVASANKQPRRRLFQQARSVKSSSTKTNGTAKGVRGDASTIKSSATSNPYASSNKQRRPMTSSASTVATRTTRATATTSRAPRAGLEHIVCVISENLAKETCVTSLDAGSPTSLLITKQGNGQTYAETLAYLEVLQPDEILLNEGRRNSQLAKKVLSLYKQSGNTDNPIDVNRNRRARTGNKRNKSRQGRHFATSAFDGEPSRRDMQDSDEDEDDLQPGDAFSGPCNTSTVVKFVPRAYFDQTKGAELLQRIARSDTYDSSLMEEYILLSSAHAALLYTQLCLGANFAKKSIHLNVNAGGNNRMNIDRSSLIHLELLANGVTGKMANSLIGTIDCTKTTVGSRLLRTNLMAPPMQVETIHTRLDLVDSFLGDENFFYTVMDHLQALPDVDKMLMNVALVPWKRSGNKQGETRVTARVASKGISALVCIKSILGAMPAFAGALEEQLVKLTDRERMAQQHTNGNYASMNDNVSTVTDGSLLIGLGSCSPGSMPSSGLRNQLLGAIVKTMKHSALPQVLNAILDIFVESTTFSRNAHAMRHQEAFALKPKTDGMMDLIRKAFLANVDDIYRLADEYAEEYGIKVSVKETTSRGYYLALPADVAADLPQIFIQPVKSGKLIHCTTEEVHSLNARAQENVQDLLMMTHERIQEVLDIARDHYDALASLSDAIALLDLCHCFADNVASSRDRWCRPIVSDRAGQAGGEISIRNGRYGIDTSKAGLSLDAGSFVPNDTHASRSRHFTVITGVNGSGKSTYLKQIAIIVILGHIGSYVPADEARIPIRDRLCTRIGTADDQEHNISTFMLEMKEAAFICKHSSEKSLILIDELGRATSNEDGVGIAWAVSEHLLVKKAMTFFVTHYPQLSKLSLAYAEVQNQHMDSMVSGQDNTEISYTHKIRSGPCAMTSDYGVEMAPSCGWPNDVVKEARKIRSEIESKLPDASLCLVDSATHGSDVELQRQANERLVATAQQLRQVGTMFDPENFDVEEARRVLEQIRLGCISNASPELQSMMNKLLAPESTETSAPSSNDVGKETLGGRKATTESSNNVITQGRSTVTDLARGADEESYSSSSTSSLSDSDSDSSSDSD